MQNSMVLRPRKRELNKGGLYSGMFACLIVGLILCVMAFTAEIIAGLAIWNCSKSEIYNVESGIVT